MFASLRYRRKHHYWSFRFASISLSFAFDVSERVYTIEACAVPSGVYTTGAWAVSDRVCTTELCVAPGGVYTHWGLCCIWTFLHYRVMCCSWRCLHTLGPELQLDASALQSYVLHLEVSAHWGLSCIWTCLIHKDQCILTVKRVCFASK